MASIFSKLPNNLIIKIVQIENDRRKCEEKKKFGEVIQELNKLSTTEYFCPSIRDMMEAPLVCGDRQPGGFGCWVAWAVKQELLFDDTADLPW
jgi:hypothetical protein